MIENFASPARLLMVIDYILTYLWCGIISNTSRTGKTQTEREKQTQKRYHDIGSRPLPPQQKGEKACVQIQGKCVVMIKNLRTPHS